jgi:hypothetical protein
MAAAIPYGQFVGGLVGGCFWVLVAIWLLYFWPRLVRRKMARGELDGNEAEAKLKKTAILGYLFILIAVCDIITTLSQATQNKLMKSRLILITAATDSRWASMQHTFDVVTLVATPRCGVQTSRRNVL